MKKETYQLVIYSENCCPKYKKVKTMEDAHAFIGKFLALYAGKLRDDNYIDAVIQNISGPTVVYSDDITVE
jgi:hypothetical protein